LRRFRCAAKRFTATRARIFFRLGRCRVGIDKTHSILEEICCQNIDGMVEMEYPRARGGIVEQKCRYKFTPRIDPWCVGCRHLEAIPMILSTGGAGQKQSVGDERVSHIDLPAGELESVRSEKCHFVHASCR
jgi:hypothetical protein